MIQMDVYEKESWCSTLSNLAMLKVFHSKGVEVAEIANDFSVLIHGNGYGYGGDPSFDILYAGLAKLYEIELYSYEDFNELEEKYKKHIDEMHPECFFVIQHNVLENISKGKCRVEFNKFLANESNKINYTEVSYILEGNELLILILWPGQLYELAHSIINRVFQKAEELAKVGVEGNGSTNNNYR